MKAISGKTYPSTHPHSCRDTISGECVSGVTADECRDLCAESDLCRSSAYTADTNTCRAFYTEIYDYVNPLESMVDSPSDDDVVFVDESAWEYPSDRAGIVRTRDAFYLSIDGLTITTESTGKPVELSKAGFVKTQLIFQDIHAPNGQVEICDSVLINRPETNLILRGNVDGELVWEPALSDNTGILDLFTFVPKTQRKCTGNTPVRWDTEYYLEYSGQFVAKHPQDSAGNSRLYLTNDQSAGILWKLTPKDFDVYYCDSGVCTATDVHTVQFKGDTAKINGSVVYRADSCMLQCTGGVTTTTTTGTVSDTDSCRWWWWLIGIGWLLIGVLVVVLWVKTSR